MSSDEQLEKIWQEMPADLRMRLVRDIRVPVRAHYVDIREAYVTERQKLLNDPNTSFDLDDPQLKAIDTQIDKYSNMLDYGGVIGYDGAWAFTKSWSGPDGVGVYSAMLLNTPKYHADVIRIFHQDAPGRFRLESGRYGLRYVPVRVNVRHTT